MFDQKVFSKKWVKHTSMFLVCFSQLRACNVSVAASGVFVYAGVSICWPKNCSVRRGPGRPTLMCKIIFCDLLPYNYILENLYLCLSLSLSLYIYVHIYVYIYIYRERVREKERERERD